jgi:hypothetical protein
MCVYCLVLVQANIYEEEDTCHMRRRIHVKWGGGYMCVYCLVLVQANIYEDEDTCHMRRRIHVCVLPGVGTGEYI